MRTTGHAASSPFDDVIGDQAFGSCDDCGGDLDFYDAHELPGGWILCEQCAWRRLA